MRLACEELPLRTVPPEGKRKGEELITILCLPLIKGSPHGELTSRLSLAAWRLNASAVTEERPIAPHEARHHWPINTVGEPCRSGFSGGNWSETSGQGDLRNR